MSRVVVFAVFRTSFCNERQPCISHVVDHSDEKTLCGKALIDTTYEPEIGDRPPDCLVCRRVMSAIDSVAKSLIRRVDEHGAPNHFQRWEVASAWPEANIAQRRPLELARTLRDFGASFSATFVKRGGIRMIRVEAIEPSGTPDRKATP